MKQTIAATLALVLAFALNSFAANAHLGTWKFNERKSNIPAGVGKNDTVAYTQDGEKIRVTMDGTLSDGKPKHSVWIGRLDGKPYPVTGSPAYNAVSYRFIDARNASIRAFRDGKLTWWGVITISRDGKTRTANLQFLDENGKVVNTKKVYDKA